MGFHVILMSGLHVVFSDALGYLWKNKETGATGLMSFIHYTLGNGFTNIYLHNWIRMPTRLPIISRWDLQGLPFINVQYALTLSYFALLQSRAPGSFNLPETVCV